MSVIANGGGPIALVLSGGAALGAVQAGILRALFATGFKPDLIVGTSVGALNGAFIAFQPNEEGLVRLERVWQELKDADIFPRNPLRMAYNFAARRLFLIENDALRSIILRNVPVDDFAATRIPFYAVATNLSRGEKHVFHGGKISTALLASTAIPGVLSPVRVNGDLFVDGGLVANLDLQTAVDLGAERILAIDIGSPSRFSRPRTLLAILARSVDLMVREMVAKDLAFLKATLGQRARITIIRVSARSQALIGDFSRVSELIGRAEAIGRQMVACCLDREGRPVPGIFDQLELDTASHSIA